MANARALLEEIGATFDDESVATLPFEALEIESVFGDDATGEVSISLFSPEAFGFVEPPELAALGPMWIAGLDNAKQVKSTIRDAHKRLCATIESDRELLVAFGFEPTVKAPEPRARGTGVVVGHSLVVTIENASLHLLRADGTPVPAIHRQVVADAMNAEPADVRKEMGLKLKTLLDTGILKKGQGLFAVNTVRAHAPLSDSADAADAAAPSEMSKSEPDAEGTKKRAVRPRRKSRLRSQSAEAQSVVEPKSKADASASSASDKRSLADSASDKRSLADSASDKRSLADSAPVKRELADSAAGESANDEGGDRKDLSPKGSAPKGSAPDEAEESGDASIIDGVHDEKLQSLGLDADDLASSNDGDPISESSESAAAVDVDVDAAADRPRQENEDSAEDENATNADDSAAKMVNDDDSKDADADAAASDHDGESAADDDTGAVENAEASDSDSSSAEAAAIAALASDDGLSDEEDTVAADLIGSSDAEMPPPKMATKGDAKSKRPAAGKFVDESPPPSDEDDATERAATSNSKNADAKASDKLASGEDAVEDERVDAESASGEANDTAAADKKKSEADSVEDGGGAASSEDASSEEDSSEEDSSDEKSADEKSNDEKSADEKSNDEKSAEEKSNDEKSAEEKSDDEKSNVEKSADKKHEKEDKEEGPNGPNALNAGSAPRAGDFDEDDDDETAAMVPDEAQDGFSINRASPGESRRDRRRREVAERLGNGDIPSETDVVDLDLDMDAIAAAANAEDPEKLDMAKIWSSAKSASQIASDPVEGPEMPDVARTSAGRPSPAPSLVESDQASGDANVSVSADDAMPAEDDVDVAESAATDASQIDASDEVHSEDAAFDAALEAAIDEGNDAEDAATAATDGRPDVSQLDADEIEASASGFEDGDDSDVGSPHEAKTRMVSSYSVSDRDIPSEFGSEIETRAAASIIASAEPQSPRGGRSKSDDDAASLPDEIALEQAAREAAADAAIEGDASIVDEDALVAAALAEDDDDGPPKKATQGAAPSIGADADVPSDTKAPDPSSQNAQSGDAGDDDDDIDIDLEVDLSSIDGDALVDDAASPDLAASAAAMRPDADLSRPTGEIEGAFDDDIGDDDTELRPSRSSVERGVAAIRDRKEQRTPRMKRESASSPATQNPLESLASVVGEGISTGKTGAIALNADAFAALRGDNSTEDDRVREEVESLRRDAEEFEARARELRDKAERLERSLVEDAGPQKPARSLAERVRKKRESEQAPAPAADKRPPADAAPEVVADLAGEDAVSLSAVEAALGDLPSVASTVLAPAQNFSSLEVRDDPDDSVFGTTPAEAKDAPAPARADGGFSESEVNATRVQAPSIVDSAPENAEPAPSPATPAPPDADKRRLADSDADKRRLADSDADKRRLADSDAAAAPPPAASAAATAPAEKSVAIVVTDARVQGPIAEFLGPKLKSLAFFTSVDEAKADFVIFIRPTKDDDTIDAIGAMGADRSGPRVLVLSDDAEWAQVAGVDHRVDLGARASEVAAQVLTGLDDLKFSA